MDSKTPLLRHHGVYFVTALLCALLLTLSACGTNFGTGSSSSTGANPSAVSTQVQAQPTTSRSATPTVATTPAVAEGQGRSYGCPSNGVITNALAPASVTLKSATNHDTISAHVGDSVEVDLSFGMSWAGPGTYDQSVLQMQPNAGDAYPAAKACMWRFLVIGKGSTSLTFTGHPFCGKAHFCPQYVLPVQFAVAISA